MIPFSSEVGVVDANSGEVVEVGVVGANSGEEVEVGYYVDFPFPESKGNVKSNHTVHVQVFNQLAIRSVLLISHTCSLDPRPNPQGSGE